MAGNLRFDLNMPRGTTLLLVHISFQVVNDCAEKLGFFPLCNLIEGHGSYLDWSSKIKFFSISTEQLPRSM